MSTDAKDVCLGHACQGQIEAGFCTRHRFLAEQPTAAAAPLSTPPGSSPATPRRPLGLVLPPRDPTRGALVSPMSPGASLVHVTATRETQGNLLENFLEAIHNISGVIEPHEAAQKIIQETCRLLDAERSTLFMVDGEELVLMIAKGAKNIRLPKTRGIAGHVASTGETLNIPDPSKDSRFDASHDLASGFTTRNILATPVREQNGEIIAVLQSINKQHGAFSAEDEIIIQNIAFHCSVVLRNASLYEAARQAETKVSSLLEMIEVLHSDPGVHTLLFTLTQRAHQLVGADRSTLYLCDHAREQLVMMQGDVDLRIPMRKGIAGHVATTGDIVNIPDCYQDARFNRAVDQKTGYRTKSMLCMPIFGEKRDVPVYYIPSPSPGAAPPTSSGPGSPNGPPSGNSGEHKSLFRQALKGRLSPSTSSAGLTPSTPTSGSGPASPSDSRSGSPVPDRAASTATVVPTTPGSATAPGLTLSVPASLRPERPELEVVGVLQLINKLDDAGCFNEADVRTLSTLLKIAGPMLQRSRLFTKSQGSVPLGSVKEGFQEAALSLNMGRDRSPSTRVRTIQPPAPVTLKGISE